MENVLNVPLDFISMEKEFAQKYQMNVRYLMKKNKNVQNATMAMNLMKKIFVLRKKMMSVILTVINLKIENVLSVPMDSILMMTIFVHRYPLIALILELKKENAILAIVAMSWILKIIV